jgi:lipid-A-disaccharide synthase
VGKLFFSVGDLSSVKILKGILERNKFPGWEIYSLYHPLLEGYIRPLEADVEDITATGLFEVLPKLPRILRAKKNIEVFIKKEKPEVVVLMDAPGFNLRLLKNLKTWEVKKVVYLILPQFWAWKENRKQILEKYCDALISVIPFERKYFQNTGVRFFYAGHPSLEFTKVEIPKEEIIKKFNLPKDYFVVFPGSRKNEIEKHLEVLKEALPIAIKEFSPLTPVVLTFKNFLPVLKPLEKFARLVALDENPTLGYGVIKYARFGWIKSGTTAFETALLETPHLIFYKVNPLTYYIAKRLVKVKYLHLANLILEEEAVPELIQNEFNPKKLIKTTYRLLENEDSYRDHFRVLKVLLTEKGTKENFFTEVGRILNGILREV